MAIPVTWKNVAVPDYGSEYDLIQKSSELLGKSLRGIGTNVADYGKRKQETDTAAFIADLSAAANDEERNQMIADASDYSGFLDMKEITARDDALELQDFARAKEEREVTAETRRAAEEEFKVATRPALIEQENLRAQAAQQTININKATEESRVLAAELKQDLGKEELAEKQQRLDELTDFIKLEKENKRLTNEQLASGVKKDTALIGHYANLGKYYTSSSAAQDALTAERVAKNKTAIRIEADRVRHGEDFEAIRLAKDQDAAGGYYEAIGIEGEAGYKAAGDWYGSAEAKAYDKAFRVNRKAGAVNTELRAQFADTVAGLNIQITSEMLIKAGVLISGKTQKIDGVSKPDRHVFNPSTQQKLERLLAADIKKKFKGTVSSALLKEMANTAIGGDDQLREGFGDAAALADEDEAVRNQKEFTRVMNLEVMEVDTLKDPEGKPVDPGTVAFDNALRNARSRLVKLAKSLGGTIKAKDIDAGLQTLVDENFVAEFRTYLLDEQGNLDPVKWKKFEEDHDISLFALKSNKTTYAAFTNFEANLVSALAGKERKVSPIAIGTKVSQIIRNIPGYATARLTATLKQKSLENIQAVQVEHQGKLEQARSDLELEVTAEGAVRYITTHLLTNYKEEYADIREQDLIDELHATRKKLHAAYPNLVKNTDKKSEDFGAPNQRAITELDNVMLKMYAISRVDDSFINEITGPTPSRQPWFFGYGGDTNISNLKVDQLREAADPYLQNFTGDMSKRTPDQKKKDAADAINGAGTGLFDPTWK